MKRSVAEILVFLIVLTIVVSTYLKLSQSNNRNEDEDYTGLEEEYAGLENLIVELKTDKIRYSTNETITIELIGFNPIDKTMRHQFATSQKFWGTISISNGSFTDVIYDSFDYSYLQVITTITIAPSSSYMFLRVNYKPTLAPGVYHIETTPSMLFPEVSRTIEIIKS